MFGVKKNKLLNLVNNDPKRQLHTRLNESVKFLQQNLYDWMNSLILGTIEKN